MRFNARRWGGASTETSNIPPRRERLGQFNIDRSVATCALGGEIWLQCWPGNRVERGLDVMIGYAAARQGALRAVVERRRRAGRPLLAWLRRRPTPAYNPSKLLP